ncbi:MAG: DMT family transporter, partial [Planktomarina sp.]
LVVRRFVPQRGWLLPAALMLGLLALIWGGAFFFGGVAVREVPPLTVTLHRVIWAIPFLYAVVWFKGIKIPRDPRTLGAYLVMGGLNNALPFSLLFWGQTQISSGLSSILNGTTALIGVVVAGLLLKDERLTRAKIIGVLFGLAGVIVIMGPDALRDFNITDLAQIAVLGSSLAYALAGVWAKLNLSNQPPQMNALGMVTGSVIWMIPLVLIIDGVPEMSHRPAVWGALLGLAVICTALAYQLYFSILARAGSANLMLVTLLIPPFAIGLGVLFLDEVLSPSAMIGFALIALGLLIIDGRLFKR